MQLCYLDEAGDSGPPAGLGGHQTASPLLVVGGIVFDSDRLGELTRRFLELKDEHFSDGNLRHQHDYSREITPEIKGGDLRNALKILSGDPTTVSAAAVIDGVLALLKANDAKIVAHIIEKSAVDGTAGEAIYQRAVVLVCKRLERRLAANDDFGAIVIDNRDPQRNALVAHSVYNEKFRATDNLPRIVEIPTFGQSENHAGIQIADLICSALLYAMTGGEKNVIDRFGKRVERLQDDFLGIGDSSRDGVRIEDNRGRPISPKRLFATA